MDKKLLYTDEVIILNLHQFQCINHLLLIVNFLATAFCFDLKKMRDWENQNYFGNYLEIFLQSISL